MDHQAIGLSGVVRYIPFYNLQGNGILGCEFVLSTLCISQKPPL